MKQTLIMDLAKAAKRDGLTSNGWTSRVAAILVLVMPMLRCFE